MHKKKDNRFGTTETVRKISISSERLRYWERMGIVKPKYSKCGTRNFSRYFTYHKGGGKKVRKKRSQPIHIFAK